MPNSSCERITIDYDQHCYSICMSNRRIYIVKKSKFQNGATTSSSSSTSVYNDANEGASSVTTTNTSSTNPASTNSSTVMAWKQQTQPSNACCRFCWQNAEDSNGSRHYNWKTPFIYLILLFICQKIHHLWALVQIYASLPASHPAALPYSCIGSHNTVASCSVASQPKNHWWS